MSSGSLSSTLFHILYSRSYYSEQSAALDASTNPHPDNIAAIAAVLGGLSFVLSIIALFMLYRRRKKEDRLESALESEPLSSMWMPGLTAISYPLRESGTISIPTPRGGQCHASIRSNRNTETTQLPMDIGGITRSVATPLSSNAFTYRSLLSVPAVPRLPRIIERRRRASSLALLRSSRRTVSQVPSITRSVRSSEVSEGARHNVRVLPPLSIPQSFGRSFTRPLPNTEKFNGMAPVLLASPGDPLPILLEAPPRRRQSLSARSFRIMKQFRTSPPLVPRGSWQTNHENDQSSRNAEVRFTEPVIPDEITHRVREWQNEVAEVVAQLWMQSRSPRSRERSLPPPSIVDPSATGSVVGDGQTTDEIESPPPVYTV